MGFTLDELTICKLASTVASEVVKALIEAQLVNDSRPLVSMGSEPDVLYVGPLRLDLARREVTSRGRVLKLKPRELDCLAALARNAGRALTREQLLELAWGDALDAVNSERTVDVHVRRLRLHLGEDACLLRTLARVGYRLDPT